MGGVCAWWMPLYIGDLFTHLQVYVHTCTCACGGRRLALGHHLSLLMCYFESGSFTKP